MSTVETTTVEWNGIYYYSKTKCVRRSSRNIARPRAITTGWLREILQLHSVTLHALSNVTKKGGMERIGMVNGRGQVKVGRKIVKKIHKQKDKLSYLQFQYIFVSRSLYLLDTLMYKLLSLSNERKRERNTS